jgi:hypothetical protein
VIGVVNPGPETLVEVIERERLLPVQVGQELFAGAAEEALDLAAAFRLIGCGFR